MTKQKEVREEFKPSVGLQFFLALWTIYTIALTQLFILRVIYGN